MIDRQIVLTGFPWVAGCLVVLTVVGAVWLARRRTAGLSLLLELACWLAAGLVAAFGVAAPVSVEEVGTPEEGRLVVLVDGSRSMSVVEGGAPRSAAVQPVVDQLLRLGPPVDLYHFGDELRQGPPSDYDLPGTDVLAALAGLRDRLGSERLAGIVVISDGLDRGPLASAVAAGSVAPPSGPLTVVLVGGRAPLVDASIGDVDAGGWAFVDTPFTLRAKVSASLAPGTRVPVVLLRDGATVATTRVEVGPDGNAAVSFDVVPTEAGRFHYELAVEPPLGDAVPGNDSVPVVVTVVRDRMRVLQVSGAPSWDVKFLRRLLKGDPGVQLVCFYILRTPEDLDSAWREDELSLIQFPYEDLFDEEIDGFDIIVLQDFDYEPYFTQDAEFMLTNVAEWVRDGGGLVYIGGDRAFEASSLAASPLADVLPVSVASTRPPVLDTYRPRLTEEGARHPLTRLIGDGTENEAWWARLPAFHGLNPVRGRAEGAAVLLEHPTLTSDDGQPAPLLAVREVEQGRSMALLADESWRWSVTEAQAGRGNQAYLRLWKNALRWLLRDPTLSRVTVDTPRENYRLGEEVRVVGRVRDPGFQPLAGVVARFRGEGPGEPFERDAVTGAEGEAIASWVPSRAGTWRIELSASTVQADGFGGEVIGEAGTLVAVTERDPELDALAPDGRMKRWAESVGGRWVPADGDIRPVLDPGAGRVRLTRHESRLDRGPVVAWCFAGLLAAAVLLRRLAGAA